ncbi:MAG: GntR family transcriptional regulator [Myxococcaceae bacterium]|nr:GntR family transcriptional regulator [Myxococcaceae bacterium]MCI0670403.1 GntR family transcriptional regulator [Myxococcaceae bacterium]
MAPSGIPNVPPPQLDADVRLHVYEHFVEKGHPPTLEQLASRFGVDLAPIRESLRRLESGRTLVLRPGGARIGVAPPFSALPTPFWVETPRGSWWAHCAWESLAIPLLLRTDAVIHTRFGAEREPLTLTVRDGRIDDAPSALMHIPLPAARWWDDVGYTCGNLLFFRSPAERETWCARHGVPRGELLTLAQALALAGEWFTGRLERGWRRLTPDEAHESLARQGLHGPFWALR